MNRTEFWERVKEERERQDREHPWDPTRRDHWARVLGEEFGEVCRALNGRDHDGASSARDCDENLKEELVQVAAVAQRIAECLP
jgi:NTP pyrophosphatase (non-canonical NTP hydrolase)